MDDCKLKSVSVFVKDVVGHNTMMVEIKDVLKYLQENVVGFNNHLPEKIGFLLDVTGKMIIIYPTQDEDGM